MLAFKEFIEEGDEAILCLGLEEFRPFVVKRGEKYINSVGSFSFDAMVGKRYGSRIYSDQAMKKVLQAGHVDRADHADQQAVGVIPLGETPEVSARLVQLLLDPSAAYIVVLFPTPELWTKALPHRTQILYAADIAMICMELDLKPGHVVLESGTGSASLTHALVRRVYGPGAAGCVHTFEFHEGRKAKAEAELKAHFGSLASGDARPFRCYHRDVVGQGFCLSLKGSADAVFLDLPRPYDVLENVKSMLRPSGGRVCSFSPCIEQVMLTTDRLRDLGFKDVRVIECLLQTHCIRDQEIESFAYFNTADLAGLPAADDHRPPGPPASSSASAAPVYGLVTRRPEAQPGHTGYLVFATHCLAPSPATASHGSV